MRTRYRVEVALAGLSAVLLTVTVVSREWVELVFGVDPDHGDGSLEWLLVLGLVLMTAVFSLTARWEWRRARVAQQT